MQEGIIIVGVIITAALLFVIYFGFKVLEFVMVAVNLYKKMVVRLDATIKLLMDIRDNTKTYNDLDVAASVDEDPVFCHNCGCKIDDSSKPCPSCGTEL